MSPAAELPILAFKTKRAWATWLATHHATSPGVWMRVPKKATGEASISKTDALDLAICYGWIDGQVKSEGERSFRQKYLPRAKRSIWSVVNREKALALIASGAMQPAGQAEVERAKQDGRWDAAYAPQRTAAIPEELAAALKASPRARAFFATLQSKNRYAILFRIHTAKKAETKTKRIAQFVGMLERGETLHPQ